MLYYRILRKIRENYYTKVLGYKDLSKKRDAFLDIYSGERERGGKRWPDNKLVAFNLQFDDFSTKHKGNSEYDYGGDPNSKISFMFKDLIKRHPYLKTTIFTIPNPKFIKNNMYNHKSYSETKFKLTNPEHKEFLSYIKSKDFQKNNEVAAHGLYHCQYDVKNVWPFMEFEFKGEKEALNTINESRKIFKEAGIEVRGFKPPSWGVGVNANYGLIKALKKSNFEYVCLSSPISGINWERKRVSNFFPERYEGLLNIPQNINMLWSWEKIKEVIDFAVSVNGIIVPQLHFIEEGNWMDDGIGEEMFNKLEKILEYLNTEYEGQIWFAKAEEIAKHWKKNEEGK